jgi:serine phosphatase RsbU (regulator of sigma subunit)/anti-sigma regulatory factor (Ser/Thr protein kinase)
MKQSFRFNLLFVLVFLVGLLVSGVVARKLLDERARGETVNNALLMMESALAVRSYTIDVIQPLLSASNATDFKSASVPAFAATQTFKRLQNKYPDFVYREAVLNPTNRDNLAHDWEVKLIEQFKNDPARTELVGEHSTDAGQSMYVARPIQIKNPACLACHTTPQSAPASLVQKYGDKGGFGWRHNELVGVQVVSVPMALPISNANRLFNIFLGMYVAIFGVLLVALNIPIRRWMIEQQQRQMQLELVQQQFKVLNLELAEKNEQMSAVSARMGEEIDLARNVQLAILPQQFPDEPNWSAHASMFPARELGGDFYDCFALPDGRYGVLVADVSGKGVGAAFFMAVSRTVLLDQAIGGRAPAEVLARANDLLCERNPIELFVTACYGIYDPRDGSLVYANAGHPPPMLRRQAGGVDSLPCSRDMALGVMPDMGYIDHIAKLEPGDTLLLYTDGVTEAFSTHNEAYGDARLLNWLATINPDASAAELVASLVKDVETFINGAEASDDLTCLLLCRKLGDASLDTPPMELRGKTLLLDYQLPSQLEEIGKLAELVDGILPERPDLAFSANLCLEELITNTIQHGLAGRSDGQIHVRISITDEWLEIILKDDAPAYDPFSDASLPNTDLGVEARPVGGLGVHLVKSLMDDARAYYDGSGNLIVLLKTLRK